MKRIVICFDGTWNALTNPKEVTNVVRVGQAVRKADDNGTAQIVYYNAGVGSGGPLDRLLGGVFGAGLRDNVKRGLAFLTLNWEKGDEIYIFGFSRGAYTARALAGVITAIGGVPKQNHFDELEEVWNFYRHTPEERKSEALREQYKLKDRVHVDPNAPFLIKCLAVWDTVGSYGIPAGLGLGALARYFTSWTRGFHDNKLNRRIQVGLQALATDEKRRAFPATTWVAEVGGSPQAGQFIEQVWFIGAHSNIGGGYALTGLSDLALIWMMAMVEQKTGLRFNREYIAQNFWPCAACSLYRSSHGWWLSSLFPSPRQLFPAPTAIWSAGKKAMQDVIPINEKVHWSVVERLGRKAIVDEKKWRTYTPRNLSPNWKIKQWREEERSSIASDPRVAQMTDEELELINLIRANHPKRLTDCVLFCDLKLEMEAKLPAAFKGLQNLLDPNVRRANWLRRVRDNWNMHVDPNPD